MTLNYYSMSATPCRPYTSSARPLSLSQPPACPALDSARRMFDQFLLSARRIFLSRRHPLVALLDRPDFHRRLG